jgi:pimeloyl-ACP methyl ester carboxylesterase
LVDDLHALLKAAGIPGPYVFVGHSLGGLLGRLFLARYPEEIAGLVLVDSFSAQLWDGLQQRLSPEDWAAFEALETASRLELQAVYPAVELLDLDGIAEDSSLSAIATLPPRPVAVLARGRSTEEAVPTGTLSADFPWDIVERESRAAQDALVRLFPGARFEIAAESGHMIQLDEPELVIEAVRAVVNTVRASTAREKEIPAATSGRGGYSKGSIDQR